MIAPVCVIKEKVWVYPGKGAWYFVRISKEDAVELERGYMWPKRGFKSIPIEVVIGETKWRTSIFYEKGGTYLLPIKKSVRDSENIVENTMVTLEIRVQN